MFNKKIEKVLHFTDKFVPKEVNLLWEFGIKYAR